MSWMKRHVRYTTASATMSLKCQGALYSVASSISCGDASCSPHAGHFPVTGLGFEGRARHGVQTRAVRLADDDRHLRYRRLGHRRHHLGAVPDDALTLDGGADHEPRHVGEEHERHVERVAQVDEASALVRRID